MQLVSRITSSKNQLSAHRSSGSLVSSSSLTPRRSIHGTHWDEYAKTTPLKTTNIITNRFPSNIHNNNDFPSVDVDNNKINNNSIFDRIPFSPMKGSYSSIQKRFL